MSRVTDSVQNYGLSKISIRSRGSSGFIAIDVPEGRERCSVFCAVIVRQAEATSSQKGFRFSGVLRLWAEAGPAEKAVFVRCDRFENTFSYRPRMGIEQSQN